MSYTISYFYRFGDFAIDLEQRVLLRGTQPVPLTPKVFDTLLALVEQHGRIVGKNELMDRLWPDSFVEESNLIFNIQHLRKALGDNARNPIYVETIARRGYRFIAQVEECLTDEATVPTNVKVRAALPEYPSEKIASLAGANSESLAVEPIEKREPTTNPLRFLSSRPISTAVAASILVLVSVSAWYLARAKGEQRRFLSVGTNAPASTSLKFEKLTQTGKNKHAVISPDGQYVAYTVEVKGQHSVWLRQLETDSGKEIVSPSDRLGGLAFSHNGQHLYFIKGLPESFALFRVALPLGGVPVRLIEKPQGSYSLSPDDSRIAFVRYSEDDKQCALMIANVDGQHERALATHDRLDRFNTPAWSPDGTSVAVAVGPSDSGSQQVRVVQFNVGVGSEVEMSPVRWFHISRIVWLPDQSGLMVVGNRSLGQPKRLWRLNHRTGEVTPMTDGMTSYVDLSLTKDGGRAVAPQVTSTSNIWIGPAGASQKLKRITHAAEDFCWTADGRIVYSSNTSINTNLWLMRPDGTDQKQLTHEGERNATPAATADGRYIIFSSNRSGVLQIWRMESDGSNAIQLTNGAGHSLPEVSPDGRWIFFNSVDDWGLWKMSIDGGEPTRLTNGHAIHPTVSPDGNLIACVGKGKGKSPKLLILSSVDGKILQELQIGSLRLSAYRLRWSEDGRSLLFAASRAGVANVYRQSLAGGAPQKLVVFDEDDIYDFGYSPDGQQLAVTRGDYQFDVVLLSGLTR
ncbi:MAG TPA: winged helix-turn-helix domain-containing protein [Pyrinomonadaceae bacterium]